MTIMNGYDLIAWLCYTVRSFEEKTQTLLYKQFTTRNAGPELYYQEVEKKISCLNRISGEKIKYYNSLSQDDIKQIEEQVQLWKTKQSDYIFILAVLSYLDRYFNMAESLHRYAMTKEYVAENVISFQALNNNVQELGGILLPNISPMWENRKRSQSALAADPLSVIENYIWVTGYEPWNVLNLYSIDWKIEKDKNLRIICSPLTNVPPFLYELKMGDPYNVFEITEYCTENVERVQATIEKTIKLANKRNADIVLFPEILSSPQCLRNVQTFVEEQIELVSPSLIVLPSSEHRDEFGKWVNETKVLDAFGDSLLTYKKQHGFQFEYEDGKFKLEDGKSKPENGKSEPKDEKSKPEDGVYFEPLDDADHNLYVLHIDGIGRLAIIICADIFEHDMLTTLLERYQINCLLMLAYSPGRGRFFDQISQAQRTSCEVVWCNACAAYEKDTAEKPCVAYWAHGHRNRECMIKKSCGKIAPDECTGCVFEIEIASDHNKTGKITREALE